MVLFSILRFLAGKKSSKAAPRLLVLYPAGTAVEVVSKGDSVVVKE